MEITMNKTECISVLNQLQGDEALELVEASIWAKKASKNKVATLIQITSGDAELYNACATMLAVVFGMSEVEKYSLSNKELFLTVEGVDTLKSLLELKELSIATQEKLELEDEEFKVFVEAVEFIEQMKVA